MDHDYEERILRNPALTARAFWHFARSYADYSDGHSPDLPKFMMSAAMMFNSDTVEQTYRMQFDSGLLQALSACPDILAGLQARLESHALDSLKALQIGCSSGILARVQDSGVPAFQAVGSQLPSGIRNGAQSVPKVFACARRLGVWFAAEHTAMLKSRLNLEF